MKSYANFCAKHKWLLASLLVLSAALTGLHYWLEYQDRVWASAHLLAAARVGDRIGVLTLLDNGGSGDTRDGEWQTAMMYAAARGDIDIVRALLDAGADAGKRDKHGGTALMCAVQSGNASLVALLIFWKVDVNARRDDGVTALTLARRLIIQPPTGTPVAPAQSSRSDIVRMLLQAGARE